MSNVHNSPLRTLEDEWLAAFAAGTLSDAKRLVISCHASLRHDVSDRLYQMDEIGGALLESADAQSLSDDFVDRFWTNANDNSVGRVEKRADDFVEASAGDDRGWMPDALRDHLRRNNIELQWRFAGPGVRKAAIGETADGERLYLLRARGGTEMPEHSHNGEEWTLILQGGYHVGQDGFTVGDLHREDENCEHQPVVDQGEECISLVAVEGRLRFGNPLVRALQPLFGV
ncbi:MAG: ChrR family anti-sigma-E factor [Pseudomonadota bacterium]